MTTLAGAVGSVTFVDIGRFLFVYGLRAGIVGRAHARSHRGDPLSFHGCYAEAGARFTSAAERSSREPSETTVASLKSEAGPLCLATAFGGGG